MTPYCWDVVLWGWMMVRLGITIGSNGWSPLKWLGSTWKQQLTEVLSWPNTAQPVFIKVSAPALSVNNTDWMENFFGILFISRSLCFCFLSSECSASLNCRCVSCTRGGSFGPQASKTSPYEPGSVTRTRRHLHSPSYMKATALIWLKCEFMIDDMHLSDKMRKL